MRPLPLAAALVLIASSAWGADRFEMQSHFWVNLHQTLLDSTLHGRDPYRSFTESERSAWLRATAIYRHRFSDRSPIFDDELIRINDALSMTGDLPPEGFAEEVTRALLLAAPVYRKHRWQADDRANRFWITVAESLLRDAGEELVRDHVRVYGAAFPTRVRVDVAAYAGQSGAYTTAQNGLVHTVISSREPANQGFAALEMLLHEASHAVVGAASGAVGPDINARAVERRLLAPRQLWHAIIFYTSGELTRRAYALRGVEYVPYAIKQNLYEQAFFGLRDPLETIWRSRIEGTLELPAAIEQMVELTGTPPPPRQ